MIKTYSGIRSIGEKQSYSITKVQSTLKILPWKGVLLIKSVILFKYITKVACFLFPKKTLGVLLLFKIGIKK